MEVKSFGIQITNVAPGDFATNIASGRYHAPVIKDSDYEVSYGESLRTMDEHVDSGSNPNEMAEAVYKIIQTPNPKIHYKALELNIYGGVNNALNEHYAASIVTNAVGFGSQSPRYYYPGNPRNYYGGIQLSYLF